MKYFRGKCIDSEKPLAFTCATGILNAAFPQLTPLAEEFYKVMLGLFNESGLEYYLFAGSMVGVVRDKKNPPWVDDLDLLVFDHQMHIFRQRVLRKLRASGFICYPKRTRPRGGMHIFGLSAKAKKISTYFMRGIPVEIPRAQIDVFFSYVDKDGCVRNCGGWGLYHKKAIPESWVSPPRYIELFGLDLPVFKEFEKDIHREYGDVTNNLTIKNHGKHVVTYEAAPWASVRKEFDAWKSEAKRKSLLDFQVDGKYGVFRDGVMVFDDQSVGLVEIVQAIYVRNATGVELRCGQHLVWIMDLNRLFPRICIKVVISEEQEINWILPVLLLIDTVEVKSQRLRRQVLEQAYSDECLELLEQKLELT